MDLSREWKAAPKEEDNWLCFFLEQFLKAFESLLVVLGKYLDLRVEKIKRAKSRDLDSETI